MRPLRALVLLACACDSDPTADPAPPDAPVRSLPPGIHAFAGTEASDSSDLGPLWELIGSARFVGLGESVHTSGGFYALKRRLIEVLIEERGFRTFAMETPRLKTAPLVAYLGGGDCDTPSDKQILGSSIFPVFSDDNTAALMRWICHWNVDHPTDPVTFFGFDIQQPVQDHAALTQFIQTYAGADAPMLDQAVARCVADNSLMSPSEPDYTACLAGLAGVEAYMAEHQAELVAAAGDRGLRLARLTIVSWRAMEDELYYTDRDLSRSYEARDIAMAHVLDELVALDAKPQAGVVIWA